MLSWNQKRKNTGNRQNPKDMGISSKHSSARYVHASYASRPMNFYCSRPTGNRNNLFLKCTRPPSLTITIFGPLQCSGSNPGASWGILASRPTGPASIRMASRERHKPALPSFDTLPGVGALTAPDVAQGEAEARRGPRKLRTCAKNPLGSRTPANSPQRRSPARPRQAIGRRAGKI